MIENKKNTSPRNYEIIQREGYASSMHLNEIVKRKLETAKVSRYRIAKDTGIDQSTLCNFLKGRRGLSVTMIDRLLHYFDIKIRSE